MNFLLAILTATALLETSSGSIPEKYIKINNIKTPLFKQLTLYEMMRNDTPGRPISPTDHKNAEFHEMPVIARNQTDPTLIADLFEGDIIIRDTNVTSQLLKNYTITHNIGTLRNAIISPVKKWPNGIVPYIISGAYKEDERIVIARAFKTIETASCIKFVPRKREPDYIHILKADGCSSYVGRNTGGQPVSIGYGCNYAGVIIHELLHSLGFWHEQSRYDRDDYVTILTENIQPDMKVNFLKYNWSIIQNFGVPYDLSSILHYGTKAFAINRGRPTIVPNTNIEIGQREYLTEKDVLKLRLLYQCDEPKDHATSKDDQQTANHEEHYNCVDKHDSCHAYAEAGECSKNPLWMEDHCSNACGYCECTDHAGVDCEIWAETGECTNNAAYMLRFCQKSCDVCVNHEPQVVVTSCHDNHPSCPVWALDGQCMINPEWMLHNCRMSCHQC